MSAPADPAAQPDLEISHRRMLALAVPMMLSHITVPLLGLVDTVTVGRLGEPALLGGVALGSVVFDLLLWSFGALRMTTIALTAQAMGAGDPREAERVFARAVAMALICALIIVLAQQPIGLAGIAIAGASPEVTAALAEYFRFRVWSVPATLLNYVLLGALLGRGRSGLGLALQVAINLANAVLSVLFVLGWGWGVAGVALGTVVAEYLGVVVGLALVLRLGVSLRPIGQADSYARPALLASLASNRDVMIRNAALMVAFLAFSRFGARAGDLPLAANAVLQNLWLFGAYFLDGFATAAETLCGMALGARRREAFAKAVRLALCWSFGTGAMLALAIFAGGVPFIEFATTSPEVRQLAIAFLPFAALAPLLGAAAFAYDGIYTGANWAAAMRDQMLLSLAGFLLALELLSGLGNAGLWFAFLTFMVLRGGLQAAFYPRLARRDFPLTPNR